MTIADAAVSPSSITINLEPIWHNMKAYGLPLFPIKAIIQLVNPHHLIIQLLKQDQPHQFRLLVPIEETTFDQSDFKVNVVQASGQSFGIRIHRKSTDEILFDTTYGPMTLTDQYVEMTTIVSSSHVYGFASDHRPSMQRSFNFEKIKLFNRKGGDGFHPFYMGLEPLAGHMHGVFWDNTYPLEVQFSPTPAVSFRYYTIYYHVIIINYYMKCNMGILWKSLTVTFSMVVDMVIDAIAF